MQEAKEVDRLFDENPDSADILMKQKPFLGVPFTAKESVQIKGDNPKNYYSRACL